MSREIIFDDGEIINSTDWEKKANSVIKRLDDELFSLIDSDECYDYKYDKYGNVLSKTKRKLKKGELMPTISPAQVTTKLNRYLRVFKPMNTAEAMSLLDTDYLEAYGYYLDIISHINEYVTYIGDKQTFSAFCNISVDTYNDLLSDANYCQVFASIEDGFVQSNFAVAEAGLVDSKTTIAKLQTKNAGHNLVKNPESLTLIQNNNVVDEQKMDLLLSKFDGMTKKIGGGKK